MPQLRDSQGRFTRLGDGLANLVSGAGTSADKRMGAFYTRPYILPEQIEAAYRSSWFVRKGIDLPPFDMTRGGRDWQADEDSVDAIEAEEKRLQLWAKLRQALTLGRLGGGLIVMGVGNEDPTTPLGDAARGRGSLKYLHVMNRWQVALGPMVTDPTNDLFGQPAYFQLTFGKAGAGQVKIHPSRVIPFRGKLAPNLRGNVGDEWFWGDSLMATVGDAVKNADAAMNGFASLIEEAKLDTVTIPNLTQTLATAEGEALVIKRVSVANQLKSTHNTRILDGGRGKDSPGETWDTRQVTWTGMPDMIRTYAAAVAGAFDIPATRFLGKSPDGMNATGTGDEANYIAKVRADQEADLRPALDRIDVILLPSAGVTVTAEAWYEFPPLQEMSELDDATAFSNRMTAITALQGTGAIPPLAFDKAMQNEAVERGWLAGLDGALAEMPEGERFPSETAEAANDDDPEDPSAIQGGGDPASAEPGGVEVATRRRAANDAAAILRSAGLHDAADALIAEVGEGADTPFGDSDEGEPRDDHGRWTAGGAIREHVTRALRSGKEQSTTSLGKVSAANAAAVKRHTGVLIEGHERVLQSSDIRHVMNSHGDPMKEAARGQVAIRKADFAHIPAIVEDAHSIAAFGKAGARSPLRLEYLARIDGHEYRYFEEIRANKVVALKTMRKAL